MIWDKKHEYPETKCTKLNYHMGRSKFTLLFSPFMPKNWNLDKSVSLVNLQKIDKNKMIGNNKIRIRERKREGGTTHQSSTLSIDGAAWPCTDPVLQLSLGL